MASQAQGSSASRQCRRCLRGARAWCSTGACVHARALVPAKARFRRALLAGHGRVASTVLWLCLPRLPRAAAPLLLPAAPLPNALPERGCLMADTNKCVDAGPIWTLASAPASSAWPKRRGRPCTRCASSCCARCVCAAHVLRLRVCAHDMPQAAARAHGAPQAASRPARTLRLGPPSREEGKRAGRECMDVRRRLGFPMCPTSCMHPPPTIPPTLGVHEPGC